MAGVPLRPAGEHGFDVPAWQRAGCLRNPCSLEPDPALFFASPELRQVRDTLLATMRGEPASVSVLTGEAGIGKTALLREIESVLGQARARVVLLSCTHVDAPWRDVLDAIPASAVLLIDDAQHCSEASLDELEHWLVTGAGGRSRLHTLISARPEATPRLQRLVDAASAAGLATASATLEPFDAVMVGEFLAHRLWRAGFTGAWPLAEDNVHRIAELSGGVPARILALAAIEFESAWAQEAVFIRPKLEASLPVPMAPAPAAAEAPARRRLVSDPGFRTAVAASVLLAVAGTAGWLAWRTVETARLGVVEVVPPAVPPAQTVAIAPPARAVEPPGPVEQKMATVASDPVPPLPRPPAKQMPLATAAPSESQPAFGTMLLAARSAEPIPMPKPVAEAKPQASAERTDDAVAAATSPPSADAPMKAEPPTTAEAAPVEAPTLAIAENEEETAPVVAADPPPAEPEPSKATAPVLTQLAQAQSTQEPAAPSAVASDPPPAPKVEEAPVAAPSAASPPPAEATPTVPAPAVAAPTPAVPATPAAPPAAAAPAPTMPVIAPSAGAPPAASSPPAAAAPPSAPAATAPPAAAAPRLSPAQITSYVRRGDELVQNGDIAAARLMYERAAAAGDPEAMRALGRTYDPRMLRQWGVVGMPADQARADEWYRKAAEAQRAAQARQ